MSSRSTRPYLSVVATSRNDDHGGNLLHRMQLFVSGLLEQCRRHQLDAELILVEWNPPANRPKLSEALSWPVENGRCDVRIIEVSQAIHSSFKCDQLPLLQMIAKNAGIRRARGEYVLATNIDILFSTQLISFIASRRLKPNEIYRADRYDVPPNVSAHASLDEQLDFCSRNVLRINSRRRTSDLSYNGTRTFETDVPSWTWGDWRRWPVTNEARGLAYGGTEYLGGRWPDVKAAIQRLQDRLFPNTLSNFMFQLPVNLHTNAAGDFTMLFSERWQALRAYPEFVGSCMHVDGLLCYMAHHSGLREVVLTDPMRIYHIEHGAGAVGNVEGDGAAVYYRATSSGLKKLSINEVYDWAIEMRRNGRAKIFNDENWGLADYELPEIVISANKQ